MPHTMIPVLQNRWKLDGRELRYYGLRNYPNSLKRILTVSRATAKLLGQMDGHRTLQSLCGDSVPKGVDQLLQDGIVVDRSKLTALVDSLDDARFCTKCVANDFFIPGLEFDESGVCAVCQGHQKAVGELPFVLPILSGAKIKEIAAKNRQSRFDVALYYTGGKDSSFLLYYLAKVLKVRVLACTWKLPVMSPNALANIEAAKQRLRTVEFLERTVSPDDLNALYKANLQGDGDICFCNTMAALLFEPTIVLEKVPLIIEGLEPVQYRNFILNGMVSPLSCRMANSPVMKSLLNIGRVLTFRFPYKSGATQNMIFLENLIYGSSKLFSLLQPKRKDISNHMDVMRNTVPHLLDPIRTVLETAKMRRHFPQWGYADFHHELFPNGAYDWDAIQQLLARELGWQGTGAGERHKGLHTSCIVEDGQDYAQFTRFRKMESMRIPSTAMELASAVTFGSISREKALRELRTMKGYTLGKNESFELMKTCDGLPCKQACGVYEIG